MGAMARRGKVIPFPVRSATSASAAARSTRADERGLVEVHRCDQAEAVVVKSLFESEDIPTFLRSRLTHSVHPFTVGAQGEVVILVPENEVMHSRGLLSRIAPGPSFP
jgi:hypothetical protein